MMRSVSSCVIKKIRSSNYTGLRNNVTTSTQVKEKWDLFCGICLERKPVITKSLNDLEISFKKVLMDLEVENSMKCDHEIRLQVDAKRSEEFKKGTISTTDIESSVGQSGLEFEDACLKECAAFQPASRRTEADEKNDNKSIERSLDKHLLYITKEKFGNDAIWVLPSAIRNDGETLRQAAERVLVEKCGTEVQAKILGNAPCGFYKYKYPVKKRKEENVMGAKVFFFKAHYLRGQIKSQTDFCWATRNELPNHFKDIYYKNVKLFLIDDE